MAMVDAYGDVDAAGRESLDGRRPKGEGLMGEGVSIPMMAECGHQHGQVQISA